MSTAAYRYSGQVWMERWDSAMTTTPLIPKGLNSWKTTSTMVAWARFAASIRAPFTASRLLITSGAQSNNSTRRCRPRASNPVALLAPIRSSTAPLLRRHLLVELFDCDPDVINNLEAVKGALIEAAKRAQATIVDVVFHEFNPFGISGVVVIAESHLSIHTWPEYRYAAVDIFSCGGVLQSEAASGP